MALVAGRSKREVILRHADGVVRVRAVSVDKHHIRVTPRAGSSAPFRSWVTAYPLALDRKSVV